MKNIIFMLLILLSTICFPALISLSNLNGAPGSQVSMPLELYTGNEGIAGIQADILFSSPISFVNASKGESADKAGKDVSTSTIDGGIRLLIYGLNQNLINDGVVANIVFSISSNAQNGTYAISLANAIATDENGSTFSLSTENGSIIVGQGGECTGSAIFVPASAHIEGAGGTKWRTDLFIFNGENSNASISMKYLSAGSDNSSAQCIFSGTISSHSSKGFDDIVLSLFGVNSGFGGISIYSNNLPISVMSRTYNEAPSGTFGQGISGRDLSKVISAGKKGILIGLSENSNYRTNVGFLNASASNSEVEVDLYSENGDLLGTLNYSLKPYELYQENQIFLKINKSDIKNGRVEVIVNSGSVFAYASIVDNKTGDPTYIEPIVK